MEEKIQSILEMIDVVLEDTTIPRNIRKALSNAKNELEKQGEEIVRTSAALYLIESITEDVNMPMHARAQIWAIISALEAIKQ